MYMYSKHKNTMFSVSPHVSSQNAVSNDEMHEIEFVGRQVCDHRVDVTLVDDITALDVDARRAVQPVLLVLVFRTEEALDGGPLLRLEGVLHGDTSESECLQRGMRQHEQPPPSLHSSTCFALSWSAPPSCGKSWT